MREVKLIAAPVRLHKILGEDEDSSPTAFDSIHDVVHNPLSRKEIPLVKAESQGPVGCRPSPRAAFTVEVKKKAVFSLSTF